MTRFVGVLSVVLLVGQTAPASRTLFSTGSVALVGSPSATAPALATASSGAKLNIGTCANGWCEVTGLFVAERSLSATQPVAAAGLVAPPVGSTYENSAGARVPSPVRTDAPPVGATAQCRDGSYSFSRTRSGTCSGHGGVARWF